MEQILGGKGKTMAEQIRSFWSHLCGIFGAIFGMIAGGTLVTIEHAGAVIGSPNCRYSSSYSKQTLSNGAVVYSCYGGGWFCGIASSGSFSNYSTVCKNLNPCYVMDGDSNYPRYYAYFLGCADGYYSTEGIGYSSDMTTTSTLSSAIGLQLHQDLSQFSEFTKVMGVDTYRSYAQSSCTYAGGYASTSSGKVYVSVSGLPSGYDIDLDSATAGRCAKCPAYDEVYNDYPAESFNSSTSTYPKSITSCYMSANTERNDAVEHDGNATGQFVWTSSCNYDDTVRLAESCYRMPLDGDCSLIVESYSDKLTATKWVNEASGIGLIAAKQLLEGSLPARATSAISCDRALCYLNAARSADNIVTFSYYINTTE